MGHDIAIIDNLIANQSMLASTKQREPLSATHSVFKLLKKLSFEAIVPTISSSDQALFD